VPTLSAIVIVNVGENGISRVLVSFKANGFGTVRDGFAEKYPQMKCETSDTKNRMGAGFDQIRCTYADAAGNELALTKRAGRVDDSMLMLTTPAYRAAAEQKSAKEKKDL